jgi:hypothetical protein
VRKAQRRTEKAAFAGLKKKDIADLLDLLSTMDANIVATLSATTRSIDDEAGRDRDRAMEGDDELVPEDLILPPTD